jgi:hypothetical protein
METQECNRCVAQVRFAGQTTLPQSKGEGDRSRREVQGVSYSRSVDLNSERVYEVSCSAVHANPANQGGADRSVLFPIGISLAWVVCWIGIVHVWPADGEFTGRRRASESDLRFRQFSEAGTGEGFEGGIVGHAADFYTAAR